jgi:hypothetical protein
MQSVASPSCDTLAAPFCDTMRITGSGRRSHRPHGPWHIAVGSAAWLPSCAHASGGTGFAQSDRVVGRCRAIQAERPGGEHAGQSTSDFCTGVHRASRLRRARGLDSARRARHFRQGVIVIDVRHRGWPTSWHRQNIPMIPSRDTYYRRKLTCGFFLRRLW